MTNTQIEGDGGIIVEPSPSKRETTILKLLQGDNSDHNAEFSQDQSPQQIKAACKGLADMYFTAMRCVRLAEISDFRKISLNISRVQKTLMWVLHENEPSGKTKAQELTRSYTS